MVMRKSNLSLREQTCRGSFMLTHTYGSQERLRIIKWRAIFPSPATL